ncbi:MAG: rhodanese-like domain-containing protein [Armatimonadota bacterium]|nr:rhodanese-like domain-containing protein [Armatimonadota bacterium]MDR7450518.1 rhodanese-like domain-containing protein [Armatimonadota bacterium]MDR7466349.1 rhodanese-like domain-containing protein [Armatimonadota bacterium]MDR7493070.1 rhodanese-like domain-containing protein [Armatimonadota bacterium]MDR7498173.1 rhodanese-like domain-containing protein [Armatimonadota bacterium]
MSRRWIAVLAVVTALAVAAPALGQAPAVVQEALLNYLANIAQDFNSISVQAVKARLDSGEKTFILDVREESEFAAGHIPGAVNIPIRTLGKNLDRLPPKDAMIIVVCRSGMRAAYVTMTLNLLGWTTVKDMAFGMAEWEKQGFPMVR